jgi:hypothetical protein
MPYHIGTEGSHNCSGFPVVKDSDGTVMGCHKTKEDAKKQLAALYINEPEATKSASGFVPPQAVRNNAKRGLELRKKYGRGGTEVGVARARDLSNGAALSLDTIKRMNSYFARHEVDKKGEGWGVDSAGYIAWLLWGGDAGRSWANKISKENENKTTEKSMINDLTTAFFEITKSDRQPDGTLMVYGKATDDALDIDQQICDPIWLDRAMPEWFKTGGNIREQHSSIAAGVAKEYEKKQDGHYIHALVVDPVSVKKVDAGVLRGFSIGIKSPRVVRDTKAANGRIIDGQIVEVSLVDRPANPNCQLLLAKSVEGESGMWKVEELIEKEQGRDSHGRFGPSTSPKEESGGGKDGKLSDNQSSVISNHEADVKSLANDVKQIAKDDSQVRSASTALTSAAGNLNDASGAKTVEEARSGLTRAAKNLERASKVLEDQNYNREASQAYRTAKDIRSTYTALGNGVIKSSSITLQLHQAKDATEQKEILMKTAKELIEQSKSFAPKDLVKFDQALFDQARQALAQLIVVEANEMTEGGNEEMSIAHLLSAVHHLFGWYDGEVAEGEVMSPEENIEMSAEKNAYVKSTIGCDCAGCEKCDKAGGCNDKMCKMHDGESMTKTTEEVSDETPKSAETHKCLECGCGIPQDSHGRTDVSTATMVSPDESPKSAEAEESTTEEVPSTEVPLEVAPTEEAPIEEEKVSDDDKLSEDVNAIVEKAVKIATESLKTEINSLVSAKEAATEKAISLESELATAKSLAVAGGPKRTIKPIDHASNDLLVKAATYKAKADASTDPDLVKGYKALYQEFIAKANAITESN